MSLVHIKLTSEHTTEKTYKYLRVVDIFHWQEMQYSTSLTVFPYSMSWSWLALTKWQFDESFDLSWYLLLIFVQSEPLTYDLLEENNSSS